MKFTHVAILAALLSISMSSISPILPVSPHTPQSSPLSPLLTNNARDEIKPFNCISKCASKDPLEVQFPYVFLQWEGPRLIETHLQPKFEERQRGENHVARLGRFPRTTEDMVRGKLIDPSGRRVASLTDDYRFRIRNASIY
ncbi:hypothetical protein QEV59_07705 [Trueperella pyogenes]|uniref:hypothetical protein n=1 Tax=Trueperella pyogenes TaxID=1661 RepID=UPI003132CD6F